MKDFALQCGAEFDEEGTAVIDHFNFDVQDSDEDHTILVSTNFVDSEVVIGKNKNPVLWKGIAHSLVANPLTFQIIGASATAYSHQPDNEVEEDPFLSGKEIALISALQSRNNARVLFSGSLDFFSNKFFNSEVQKQNSAKKSASGNRQLSLDLAKWTFQARGLLKLDNEKHVVAATNETPDIYRIKQDIVFSVDIKEWNGKEWIPFVADDESVMLEFIMLDPYIRTYLKGDKAGHFESRFKTPDVYGIFTFKLSGRKMGYSSIESISRVSVRPFRHDEYERYLLPAYPYYAGAFSMIGGFVLFSLVFLCVGETK